MPRNNDLKKKNRKPLPIAHNKRIKINQSLYIMVLLQERFEE